MFKIHGLKKHISSHLDLIGSLGNLRGDKFSLKVPMNRAVTTEQVRRYHYAVLCCQIIKKLDQTIFSESDRGRVFTTELILELNKQPLVAHYVLCETYDDEWRHRVLRDNYAVSLPTLERQLLRENTNFVRTAHAAKIACALVRERYLHHHAHGTADLRTNAWALTSRRFTVEQRGIILRIFRESGFGDCFVNMKTLNMINDDNAEELERVMRIRIDAEITSIAAAQTQTLSSLLGNLKFLTGTSGA